MAAPALLVTTLFAMALALPATVPAQRTAPTVCKDGSMLPRGNRRFCAPHGGVDYSATGATRRRLRERASTRAQARGPVSFTCRDGTKTGTGGWNACAHHGGLAGNPGARSMESRVAPRSPGTPRAATKRKTQKGTAP